MLQAPWMIPLPGWRARGWRGERGRRARRPLEVADSRLFEQAKRGQILEQPAPVNGRSGCRRLAEDDRACRGGGEGTRSPRPRWIRAARHPSRSSLGSGSSPSPRRPGPRGRSFRDDGAVNDPIPPIAIGPRLTIPEPVDPGFKVASRCPRRPGPRELRCRMPTSRTRRRRRPAHEGRGVPSRMRAM